MRALRQEERELLSALLNRVLADARPQVKEDIFAIDLTDGGMGSIRIATGHEQPGRRMGRELAAAKYEDEDGVLVSVSLNVDQHGELFEIDMWKVDFSPLRRFPRPEDLHREPS